MVTCIKRNQKASRLISHLLISADKISRPWPDIPGWCWSIFSVPTKYPGHKNPTQNPLLHITSAHVCLAVEVACQTCAQALVGAANQHWKHLKLTQMPVSARQEHGMPFLCIVEPRCQACALCFGHAGDLHVGHARHHLSRTRTTRLAEMQETMSMVVSWTWDMVQYLALQILKLELCYVKIRTTKIFQMQLR